MWACGTQGLGWDCFIWEPPSPPEPGERPARVPQHTEHPHPGNITHTSYVREQTALGLSQAELLEPAWSEHVQLWSSGAWSSRVGTSGSAVLCCLPGKLSVPPGSCCCSQLVFVVVVVVVHRFAPYPALLQQPPLTAVGFLGNCLVVLPLRTRLWGISPPFVLASLPVPFYLQCKTESWAADIETQICTFSNCHVHTESSSVCHVRAGSVKCIQILAFQIMFLTSITCHWWIWNTECSLSNSIGVEFVCQPFGINNEST